MRVGLACASSIAAALVACAGCERTPDAARTSSAVVYGTDDRVEPFESLSTALRAVAESAVAVEMRNIFVDRSDPANVRVTYRGTLGSDQGLCAGERFAEQPDPGVCSGTLIDERHILTAGHCVAGASACDGSNVWVIGFRYESAGRLATLTSDDVYTCARVLAQRSDGLADHGIVELDRPVVGHTPAPVRALAGALALGTRVVLIGHPNGIPVKIAAGGAVTATDGLSLQATVDAFSGNSGSGVFDEAGQLVAILDSGAEDYVARGSCHVVHVIDPPPTDSGEGLTYARAAIDALCSTPGVDSSLCGCVGPCVPAPPGDVCTSAERIEPVTQVVTGTLAGTAPDSRGSCGGNGPDRVYHFELVRASRLRARSSGFDSVLYLRAGCDGAERACNDDASRSDVGSAFTVTLSPGGYDLFVDSYDGDVGVFALDLAFDPVGGVDAGVAPLVDAGPVGAHDAAGEDAARLTGVPGGGGGCAVASGRGVRDVGATSVCAFAMLAALGSRRWRRRL